MDESVLESQLARTISETHLEGLGERYQGKVRDTYRRNGQLVLVTTDRISAFDHILPQTIPFKGQVLNQTAGYFFDATSDLVPNHVLDVPDPNVMVVRACTPIKIEFVVRGYLAGHAWREYDAGSRTLCGHSLPDGLRQSEKLPEPIVTPTTKAETGHDEDVTREEAVEASDLSTAEYDKLERWALALFERGTVMAADRDLILVDTKYEFGRTAEGDFLLIDEVHTPDSSRYFYKEGYEDRLERGVPQEQLSKEFVREWLMDHDFQGREGETMPDLPDSFRMTVSKRYIELYEKVTGLDFEPDLHPDPEARIREALEDHFADV